MSDPKRRVFGLALTVSLAACVNGQMAPLPDDPNSITSAELAHSKAASVYEAIRQLRPLFLRTRGPSSILNSSVMGPAVIVDQTFLRGVPGLAHTPLPA